MALFGQGTPQIGNGFAALGDILTGGLQRAEQAGYESQMDENTKRQKQMEEAAIARSQRIARGALTPENIQRAGYAPEQAALLAGLLGSANTPTLTQFGKLQVPGAGAAMQNAQRAMGDGDFAGYNQNIALATQQPYQPTRNDGGVFIADGAAMGDLTAPGGMVLTPQSHSEIALDQARIAQANAATALAQRRTAHVGVGDGDGGFKVPSGYMMRADGTGVDPIPGYVPRAAAKPTEDMNKSAGYAIRMEKALGDIAASAQQDPSSNRPGIGTALLDMLPTTIGNFGKTGERQNVEAAQLDALDAALTLNTGAAYTKEQLYGLRRAYFPQPGDEPATIEAKKTRLQSVIETARLRARSAYPGGATQGAPNGAAMGDPATTSQSSRKLRYNPQTGEIE